METQRQRVTGVSHCRHAFVLPTILAIVPPAAIALGCYAELVRAQPRAEEKIRAIGGSIWYHSEAAIVEFPGHHGGSFTRPVRASADRKEHWRRLRAILGPAYSDRVIAVEVLRRVIPPRLLAEDSLRSLEWLSLRRCHFPRGVMDVNSFAPRVRFIELGASNLSDQGLTAIARLQQLQMLDVSETDVTDTGLAGLKGMPSLRVLDLSGTSITDEGLNHLIDCRSLEAITLRDTKVTKEGVQKLRRLPSLSYLNVLDTQLSDKELSELRSVMPTVTIVPSLLSAVRPRQDD